MDYENRPGLIGRITSSITNVVALGSAIVAIAGAGIFVANFNRDFEDTKQQVAALRQSISVLTEKSGLISGAGSAGEKGRQGPEGQAGPEGPRGPKGDAGEVDLSSVRSMVGELVKAEIANSPQVAATPTGVLISQPGLFDFSKCISLANFQAAKTAVIRKNMEICGTDGRLLLTFEGSFTDSLSWRVAGGSKHSCYLNNDCDLSINGSKTFTLERIAEDEQGLAHLLRFR